MDEARQAVRFHHNAMYTNASLPVEAVEDGVSARAADAVGFSRLAGWSTVLDRLVVDIAKHGLRAGHAV